MSSRPPDLTFKLVLFRDAMQQQLEQDSAISGTGMVEVFLDSVIRDFEIWQELDVSNLSTILDYCNRR